MNTSKVNINNWMNFPENRWAFRNIDKILPTATVLKPENHSELPNNPTDFKTFNLEHNGAHLDLASYISQSQLDGLIILQHGKVLFEDYFNNNTKDSKHIVMSITKSITGFLVGILQAQGKLDVDDLVSEYVPEISDTVYKDKTIRQCVDMRSGMLYVDGQHEYRAAAGWHPRTGTERSKDLKDFLIKFTPQEEIDDRFEYVSPNTDLIGWVLERASGKSFANLVQELLWEPMGAESDALVCLDPKGFARAAGGLCVTLRDLARFAQIIVQDGENAKGDVVVPKEWIQDVLKGGSREAWQEGKFARVFEDYFEDMAYRSACYVHGESETVMGFGIFGQTFIVDRKNGIVLVATASQETPLGFDKIRMTLGAFKEFRRIALQD